MSQNDATFVDTSSWAGPFAQDTDHQLEMGVFSRGLIASGRSLITTNYVLSELVPLLTARTAEAHALEERIAANVAVLLEGA